MSVSEGTLIVKGFGVDRYVMGLLSAVPRPRAYVLTCYLPGSFRQVPLVSLLTARVMRRTLSSARWNTGLSSRLCRARARCRARNLIVRTASRHCQNACAHSHCTACVA